MQFNFRSNIKQFIDIKFFKITTLNIKICITEILNAIIIYHRTLNLEFKLFLTNSWFLGLANITSVYNLTKNLFTVGEIIIAIIKMRKYFWYPLKILDFQYCDSNIGLFPFAPHLVIAHPTLRYQKLTLLISLL